MSIVYDPVNLNAASGTELMMRGLEQRLDKSLLDQFSIGRAIMLFKDSPTIKIYWSHNLPGQMGIREVSENLAFHPNNRWKFFDRIVFVSDWQKQQYINHFKLDEQEQKKLKVLRNAIKPIAEHTKPTGPIKLIYMSVPERGLQLLYSAFENLSKKYDIELYVYSSYQIYGIPNADVQYRQLFDSLRSHPKVNYYGSVSNEQIHKALQKAHIFAYPSVFKETSCISMLEAMSAKCLCVHPNIAAMEETAAGFTNIYDFVPNRFEHINTFEKKLEEAIQQYISGDINHLEGQKKYVDDNYSWEARLPEWNNYLNEILGEVNHE
jgi:UDP-glucose:(glucosyl)LPS alpha-1,2-glucosyltransferase